MSNPDQSPASPEPMFWVRLRSDGGYEGPIHNDAIERVRKESGGWTPLYPHVAPTEAAAMAAGPYPADKIMRRHLDECANLLSIIQASNNLGALEQQTSRLLGKLRGFQATTVEAPVAGQPAEPSPASYNSVERIMKLQEDCDALRTALEVIALGEAEDPVRDAGDTLVDLGHWRADALAQHRAEVAAPKGDSNG